MTTEFMIGGLTATRGLCPVCGAECPRMHGWTLHGVRDTYACHGCGVTEYRVAECAS